MRWGFGLAPDAGVGEAERAELLRVEEVAAIEEERTEHFLFDGLPGEGLEIVPFGEEEESVGTLGDVLGFLDHFAFGNEGLRFFHRLGIVSPDLGALGDELLDDADGDAAADVVGVALESEAEHADFLVAQDPEGFADFLEEALGLVGIDAFDFLEKMKRVAEFAEMRMKAEMSLGKQEPP